MGRLMVVVAEAQGLRNTVTRGIGDPLAIRQTTPILKEADSARVV